jgi:transcriptional regulator with XRE-family HTH domain
MSSSSNPPNQAQQLGERLKEMRAKLGMTQLEFAEALQLADRSVKRYEAGSSTIPSDVILRMTDLGIDPAYLFGVSATPQMAAPDLAPVDEEILREVVDWVDGEWAGVGRMDDFERLAWIVREYTATVNQRRAERDGAGGTSPQRSRAA